MNFLSSKKFRFAGISLIGVVAIAAIILAATHNSKDSGKAVVSNSSNNSSGASASTSDPSVSSKLGVEPVIGAPSGAAPTSLVKTDIVEGNGATALSSSTVTAQYVLMSWKTGKVLQSSWSSGPFTAPLSGVIPGWQQGIPGMKVGGRRLLVIPPALAYGAAGGGPVGPNETLVFVVDLLGVK